MPPMGGVTGAMRGTNRRGIGAKAARPKNMKHTVMRLFSYMKKDVWMLAAALLCVVAGTVSTLAASYMLRPIINDYIIPAKTTADLKKLAGALIVRTALCWYFLRKHWCACAVIYLCIWKSCRYGFLIPIPKEI